MTIYQSKRDRLWHIWNITKPGYVMECGQVCGPDNLYSTRKIGSDYQDPPRSETCPICFPRKPEVLKSPRPGFEFAPDLSIDPQHDIWAFIDDCYKDVYKRWDIPYEPIDREKFPLRIDRKILHGNRTIYEFHLQDHSLRDFVSFYTNMAEASLDSSNL